MYRLVRRHFLKGLISLSIVGAIDRSLSASASLQNGQHYYLRHQFSGKYLCSGETENGGKLWLWGPIPDGHEVRYKFKLTSAGQGYYYLRHQFSGKYLCSGETENGGKLWLWSPIPDGHEVRYKFRLTSA